VALWVVATHAFDAFFIFPRLLLTAPEKGCGKSTLLDVLSRLVRLAIVVANISAAALFRVIERDRPTLFLDEADSYLRHNEDMRGVLNAGHRRDGAVMRCVGENHDPRKFSAWAPVALAAIGHLPGTIEDRSIKIGMRRRRAEESVERLRLDRTDGLEASQRKAVRWAIDHAAELAAADPEVPDGITNRAADNWRPLLAVAEAVGGAWPERARHAAVLLTREHADDSGAPGIMLLVDLRELFDRDPTGVLFTRGILTALHDREDRPWGEFRQGRQMTPRQMAELLRPYGIPTNQTVRRGAHTGKGYRAADFADAWERYLPPRELVTR